MNRLMLSVTTCAAIAFLVVPAVAEDYWVKAQGSGCEVWSDEAMGSNEVVVWSGSCLNGKASGEGTLTWTEGGKPAGSYEGSMENGKLNGLGTLRLIVEGGTNQLEGIFKDGDIDGIGRLTGKDGNVYEGELKDDLPNGTGYRKTGDVEFLGEFENGLRQGVGLEIGPDTAYLGEFDKDVAAGSGTLEDEQGGRFHGQFRDGKPNGFGTYVSADGAAYQGTFVDGKADGTMLVTTQGKTVVEHWKDGERTK